MSDITLLPGWSLAAEAMQPLADELALPEWRVHTSGLPALQMSTLETDLADLADTLKPGVLVGWSLGGMLAVQLQRRFPERFSRVITIASNACFVARKDWPSAMPADTFRAFLNDFRLQPEKTLMRREARRRKRWRAPCPGIPLMPISACTRWPYSACWTVARR